jgi:CRP-like cAMP-binding protein
MKNLISRIDLFNGLDKKILEKIGEACVVRPFRRNETIVRQGELSLGLYLIAKGRVKVDREHDGVRMQVIELGPAQAFGEMSLLDNKPSPATVTGLEATECVLLMRDKFVILMNAFPEVPIHIARVLGDRQRVANDESHQAALAAAMKGASPAAPVAISGKAQIHAKLLETFNSMYAIKALSRFSVAILGCPVEGIAVNTFDQIRVGDVKALFFPADEPVDMRIAALEPGSFTLDVFTPSSHTYHFGPVAVHPADRVHMTVCYGDVTLRHGERLISFSSLNSGFLASYS